jgi:hypothetical protein
VSGVIHHIRTPGGNWGRVPFPLYRVSKPGRQEDHFTVPLRQDLSAPDPSHLAAQVHFGIQTTLDNRKGGTPCFHHLLLLISTFVASSYTTVLCRTTSSAQCHDSSLHSRYALSTGAERERAQEHWQFSGPHSLMWATLIE